MKVLLVDDRPQDIELLVWLLQDRGMRVTAVNNVANALEIISQDRPFDYAISDYLLGPNYWNDENHNGAYLLTRISEISPGTKTILYTLSDNTGGTSPSGIDAWIQKQGGTKELLAWIDIDIKRRKAGE